MFDSCRAHIVSRSDLRQLRRCDTADPDILRNRTETSPLAVITFRDRPSTAAILPRIVTGLPCGACAKASCDCKRATSSATPATDSDPKLRFFTPCSFIYLSVLRLHNERFWHAAHRPTSTRVSVSLDSRWRARFHTSRSPSFLCRLHRSGRSQAWPFPPRRETADLSESLMKAFCSVRRRCSGTCGGSE